VTVLTADGMIRQSEEMRSAILQIVLLMTTN